MAKSFENLDYILPDWPRENVEKTSCRGCEQVLEQKIEKHVSFWKMTRKNYLRVQETIAWPRI